MPNRTRAKRKKLEAGLESAPASWETTVPPDKRDRLIEQAKYGEISGDEADAEAKRLGLGSLSHRPGRDDFRPESLSHWTLPMVLAWISYLDLEEVREWSAPYREQCWHWVWRRWQVGFDGPIHEGWLLEQRSKPTVSLLAISAAIDGTSGSKPMSVSLREAQESLWIMLRDGFLKATGIDTSTDRRVEIPSVEWHDLRPVQVRNDVDELHRDGLRYGAGYRDVLLPSAIVQRYWRRENVPVYALPALIAPSGNGYMPLFCAAHWIATNGGQRDFDPGDVENWRPAFEGLLSGIASEAIRVVGMSENQKQPVPAYLFAGIRVDFPYAESDLDLILSDELVLRSHPYVGEEDWFKGYSDALSDRRGDRWSRLMVEKSDVLALWPFAYSEPIRSGSPGRPSSMQLVRQEFEKRREEGTMCITITEESRFLAQWLSANHKGHPPLTAKTIRNNLGAAFRAATA